MINEVASRARSSETGELAILVDAFKSKYHPIEPPDPIAALQFRMEQQGLTRRFRANARQQGTGVASVDKEKTAYAGDGAKAAWD